MSDWSACKKLLCIRADNMGDVLMSSPALRALKETFNPEISLLTSSKGDAIAHMIPYVDHVITANLPWVQSDNCAGSRDLFTLAEKLKADKYDGCIIFTVYSQSALPAAMLATLSDIPLVLAYCRENPYRLVSHWVVEREPYEYIKHQSERDLKLVAEIGAKTEDETLAITTSIPLSSITNVLEMLTERSMEEYIILHAGVSEEKRKFPGELWVDVGARLLETFGLPLLLTGTADERELCESIASGIGEGAYVVAGDFSLAQLVSLVKHAKCLLTVNTGIVHIASAVFTPTVVLYARTNPQHKPWKNRNICLEFSIKPELQSRNQVIAFVNEHLYQTWVPYPSSSSIVSALEMLMTQAVENHSV
jgi:ADP-heptose:LPS heptosyltransferase